MSVSPGNCSTGSHVITWGKGELREACFHWPRNGELTNEVLTFCRASSSSHISKKPHCELCCAWAPQGMLYFTVPHSQNTDNWVWPTYFISAACTEGLLYPKSLQAIFFLKSEIEKLIDLKVNTGVVYRCVLWLQKLEYLSERCVFQSTTRCMDACKMFHGCFWRS